MRPNRPSRARLQREAEKKASQEAYEALNDARDAVGLPRAHVPRPYILSPEEEEEMASRGIQIRRKP